MPPAMLGPSGQGYAGTIRPIGLPVGCQVAKYDQPVSGRSYDLLWSSAVKGRGIGSSLPLLRTAIARFPQQTRWPLVRESRVPAFKGRPDRGAEFIWRDLGGTGVALRLQWPFMRQLRMPNLTRT